MKSIDKLVDILINSMEHIQTEEEFIEYVVEQVGYERSFLQRVYREYSKLSPTERETYYPVKWKEFLINIDKHFSYHNLLENTKVGELKRLIESLNEREIGQLNNLLNMKLKGDE